MAGIVDAVFRTGRTAADRDHRSRLQLAISSYFFALDNSAIVF